MQQNYSYQGWSFSRDDKGNLTIEPGIVSKKDTTVFGEQVADVDPTRIEPLTIPQDDVHRLMSFYLSGDSSNNKILDSIRTLHVTKVA